MSDRLFALAVGLLIGGVVALAIVLIAQAEAAPLSARASTTCFVMDPIPPPRIIEFRGERIIGAEFANKCVGPVSEMGAYACLEELRTPWSPPRLVECHTNRDLMVWRVPHVTSVFMAATCSGWSKAPRWYQVTGHAWAISHQRLSFRSPRYRSERWSQQTGSKGEVAK